MSNRDNPNGFALFFMLVIGAVCLYLTRNFTIAWIIIIPSIVIVLQKIKAVNYDDIQKTQTEKEENVILDLGDECEVCNNWFETSQLEWKQYLEKEDGNGEIIDICICKECLHSSTIRFITICCNCEKISTENEIVKSPLDETLTCPYCLKNLY
jgi:hypothetical protein